MRALPKRACPSRVAAPETAEKETPTWKIALRWVGVCFGAVCVFWGFFDLHKAVASRHWPVTEGKVATSDVEDRFELTDQGKNYKNEFVKFKFSFRYAVDGVAYSSDDIAVGSGGGSLLGITGADQFLYDWGYYRHLSRKYPVGSRVGVSYDPQDPRTAVLEAGLTLWSFATLVSGVAMVMTGLISLGLLRTPAFMTFFGRGD